MAKDNPTAIDSGSTRHRNVFLDDEPLGWEARPEQGVRSDWDLGGGRAVVLQSQPAEIQSSGEPEDPAAGDSEDAMGGPPGPQPAGRVVRRTGRTISERTTRTLPERLSTAARAKTALQALITGRAFAMAEPGAAGPPEHGRFALPARTSPLFRAREVWRRTDDRYRLERMILAPRLQRCVSIAIVSPKGGVGKTTTAALLGSLLAFLRRDRVVAVDANPDWGSLGRRLAPGHPVFIDDLLAGPLDTSQARPTQLDAALARGPDGLLIAPSPTEPERASQLDEEAYRRLFARLGDLVGTLMLDCGTGLDSPAARAALACADQLVLVTDGEPDTASLVAEAAARQLSIQPRPVVLLVNKLDRASRVAVAALERQIDFADGLVLVPNHRAGADALLGSRFSWGQAPVGWQIAFREFAALLAAGWTRLRLAV